MVTELKVVVIETIKSNIPSCRTKSLKQEHQKQSLNEETGKGETLRAS
jgi:hypothetical protein